MLQENDLIKLLQIDSDEINSAFNKASIEGRGTPQEISDRRELAFSNFLKKYFPFPYRIAKGNIIDSFGRRSQSIDIIIINPIHPYTISPNSDKFSVILADGVDAAIEIKPILKNDEIHKALKQIQSVKMLRRKNCPYLFEKRYSEQQIECSKQILSIIFSIETYTELRLLIAGARCDIYKNDGCNVWHVPSGREIRCVDRECCPHSPAARSGQPFSRVLLLPFYIKYLLRPLRRPWLRTCLEYGI